jgi:hypothetical protein
MLTKFTGIYIVMCPGIRDKQLTDFGFDGAILLDNFKL